MEDLPKGLANSGAKEIKNGLMKISGGKVLDVATEGGDFINTLMKALKDYDSFVGIDISAKELKSAIKKFKDKPAEFIEMNAENLDFKDNTFDTVSTSHSLHHLADINKVLSEMKRVLKPDGYFILQEGYSDGEQTQAQKTEILQHYWGSKVDSLMGSTHNKTLIKQKIIDHVDNVGLKIVETIESTHSVKCLFCEDKYKCEDPKNEEMVNFSIKEIDNYLGRLKEYLDLKKIEEHPNLKKLVDESKKLIEEGEKLKERNRQYGTSEATHLFFIGKK
ncbi:MAG: class I SAM-dependent methyltransferase [Candidatus Hodarchaeales archaeon]